MPELSLDRPARDTDVARAALEVKMVQNHRFCEKKLNRTETWEGVTNPKRTCANREGEPQITQTPVESYTGVAMVDMDFDTLNRGDQV